MRRLPTETPLRVLPAPSLALLRHALRQGHLDPASLARVLGEAETDLRARLAAMAAKGLLVGSGDRYTVPEHLLGPVRSALSLEGWR